MAYTPMLEASKFLDDAEFKTQFFQTHVDDKPLVAHFCGNDPKIVGAACKEAARLGADAVDLNLGCPQRVAYAGHYGSCLMKQEDRELVKSIVRAMRRDTPPQVVVCVKIRLMDTQPDTLQLVEDLRDSGAQVVALHGRRRATWHRDGPGLCGNHDPPCHRAEAVTRTTSRRWRGAPKGLISTQALALETARRI